MQSTKISFFCKLTMLSAGYPRSLIMKPPCKCCPPKFTTPDGSFCSVAAPATGSGKKGALKPKSKKIPTTKDEDTETEVEETKTDKNDSKADKKDSKSDNKGSKSDNKGSKSDKKKKKPEPSSSSSSSTSSSSGSSIESPTPLALNIKQNVPQQACTDASCTDPNCIPQSANVCSDPTCSDCDLPAGVSSAHSRKPGVCTDSNCKDPNCGNKDSSLRNGFIGMAGLLIFMMFGYMAFIKLKARRLRNSASRLSKGDIPLKF
jgi:hypothetical protein